MSNSNVSVKVGDVVNVMFCTGGSHPLANKVVPARITMIGGYNGKCIEAETLEQVHHPEDPEGILVFDKNGNFLRYKVRPAFDEVWKGWVEKVVA
jgi:hypothetical protein